MLHGREQARNVARAILQAEADPHEPGQESRGKRRCHEEPEVGGACAQRMDVQELLDQQVCAETATAHADPSLLGELLPHQVVRDVARAECHHAAMVTIGGRPGGAGNTLASQI